MNTLYNKTTVTEQNIEALKEQWQSPGGLPSDQAKELYVGCITQGFTYEGQQRGQYTIYPEGNRIAIYFGADSDWGDYYPSDETYILDDDGEQKNISDL